LARAPSAVNCFPSSVTEQQLYFKYSDVDYDGPVIGLSEALPLLRRQKRERLPEKGIYLSDDVKIIRDSGENLEDHTISEI
jgi:hypothetical protein